MDIFNKRLRRNDDGYGIIKLEWIVKKYRVDNDNNNYYDTKLDWTVKRYRVVNNNNSCDYDDNIDTICHYIRALLRSIYPLF